MNSQPIRNIMKTGEWPDTEAYRVACECHDNLHDLDVWIEVESDQEVREITVTFYKEMYTPIWDRGFNRFREAFRMLFFGQSRIAGSIILKQQVAANLVAVIQDSIKRLEKQ